MKGERDTESIYACSAENSLGFMWWRRGRHGDPSSLAEFGSLLRRWLYQYRCRDWWTASRDREQARIWGHQATAGWQAGIRLLLPGHRTQQHRRGLQRNGADRNDRGVVGYKSVLRERVRHRQAHRTQATAPRLPLRGSLQVAWARPPVAVLQARGAFYPTNLADHLRLADRPRPTGRCDQLCASRPVKL